MLADSFDFDFFKLRAGKIEVVCNNHLEAFSALARDFRGKYVEVTFPCPKSGKLISEFYYVSKKGVVSRDQVVNQNELNLAC